MRREQIEAQLAADPTDDATYLILADILQLEGDPRGELIAIDARGDRAARAAHLERHPEVDFKPDGMDLVWHLGFVRRARLLVGRDHLPAFADPAMRYLTELVCPLGYGHHLATDLEHVRAASPTLRFVAFGDPDGVHLPFASEGNPEVDCAIDDVVGPLERVFAATPIRFRRAPRLRDLELRAMWPAAIDWLARAELPVLERLAVHVGNELDPIALLACVPPTVTHLELAAPRIGDRVLRTLATAPLLRRLTSLRLWNADVTLDGARHVTREAFGHLALLDLSDPLLDDATIAAVAGACPDVRTVSPVLRSLLRR